MQQANHHIRHRHSARLLRPGTLTHMLLCRNRSLEYGLGLDCRDGGARDEFDAHAAAAEHLRWYRSHAVFPDQCSCGGDAAGGWAS